MIVTRLIYDSGDITASGNSGWLPWPYGEASPGQVGGGVVAVTMRVVPQDLATDETLDIDLDVAWDAGGAGAVKVHDFTQITSSNAAASLVVPGGESVANLVSSGELAGPLPPYFKFTHTLGGTTKSMRYKVYASVLVL